MYTLPLSFKEQIISQKGELYYQQLEKAILETESLTSIRFQREINNTLLTHFDIDDQVLWESNASYLKSRPFFAHDPLWHAGIYYVQEASSMILGYLLKACFQHFSNLKVLDLCASPGGKSSQVLSLLDNQSILVSNEILPKRAQVLKENIVKSGYSNCIVTNNDSKDFLGLQGMFDLVIIDAPCSGEGLFRKDKDAINEWSTNNVYQCTIRQVEILNNAIHLVKENGILVYSTCTYNRSENIDQIHFLLNTGLFECVHIDLPEAFQIETIVEKNAIGYQANPSNTKGEGFFISILKKIKSSNSTTYGRENNFSNQFVKLDKKQQAAFEQFISNNNLVFYEKTPLIYCWNNLHNSFIMEILNKLKVISCPTFIGELKKDIFIPSQDLAFSRKLLINDYPFLIEVDKDNAIKYLKKENIDKALIPEIQKSNWYIIKYLTYNLGWLKVLPNQKQNNYFPLEWRLRK